MVRVWLLLSLHTPVLRDTPNNTRRQISFPGQDFLKGAQEPLLRGHWVLL